MKVPWMPKASIARMAGDVISDYEANTGKRVVPPIPVEDIIEFGLASGCLRGPAVQAGHG